MRRIAIVAAAAALLAPAATAQEAVFVLVDCDAQMRASILETSSILDARGDMCAYSTGHQSAWQAQLLSRHGDLVRVATLERGVADTDYECSLGPFGDLPMVLSFYVPAESIVPTVAELSTVPTRDKRTATLKRGVALHPIKGPWFKTATDTEVIEVKVPAKARTEEFGRPPRGACAVVEPKGDPADWFGGLVGTPTKRWFAPAESSVFLPTREEIGMTTAEFGLPEETYQQGLLRCTSATPLGFAQQGPAPICFLEIALSQR